MVAKQVPPGQPDVLVREARAVPERSQGCDGLRPEQAALGALVRLLQVHARGVDPAEDVLQPAPDELALVRGQCLGLRLEVREPPDPKDGPEFAADLRQLRLDGKVVGAVREHDRVLAGAGNDRIPLAGACGRGGGGEAVHE